MARDFTIAQPTTGMSPLGQSQISQSPGLGRYALGMGIDVGGGVASQALGASLAPFTAGISYPVLSFVGGMVSNYAAQKAIGDDFSLGQMIGSGALNIIPGAGKLAATATGKLAVPQLSRFAMTEAIRSGGIAAGERTIQTAIDEGRFPTFDEYLTSASLGAGFGTVAGFGIGIASQKGLIDKIANKTAKQFDLEIAKNPKVREQVKTLLDENSIENGSVIDGPLGRSESIYENINKSLDRAKIGLEDGLIEALAADVSTAQTKKEADFIIDQFIDSASKKKSMDLFNKKAGLTQTEYKRPSKSLEALSKGLGRKADAPDEQIDISKFEQSAAGTQCASTGPTYEKFSDFAEKIYDPKSDIGIDYGAGFGTGAEFFRKKGFKTDTYEPYPEEWQSKAPPTFSGPESALDIPSDTYDFVTNFSVLNVLRQDVRDDVVREIGRVLKPGASAYITARTARDVNKAKTKKPVKGEGPNAFIVTKNDKPQFQKGFTPPELRDYLSKILGDDFAVTGFSDPALSGVRAKVTKLGSGSPKSSGLNFSELFASKSDPDAVALKKEMRVAFDKAYQDYGVRSQGQNNQIIADTVRTAEAINAAEIASDLPKILNPGLKGSITEMGRRFIKFVQPSKAIAPIARILEENKDKVKKYDTIADRTSVSVNKALSNLRLSAADRDDLVKDINKFVEDGVNNMPDSFFKEVGEDLIEWRGAVEDLQYDLLSIIGSNRFKNLNEEQAEKLTKVITESIIKKNYATKTYRFYEDASFVPDQGTLQREALNEEIERLRAKKINDGMDEAEAIEAATDQATDEMNRRMQYSANNMKKPSQRAKRIADASEMKFQAEGILAGKTPYGPKMKEFLGEIEDPSETMRQTLAKTARLTNALRSDEKLLDIFTDPKIKQALGMNTDLNVEPILTQTSFGKEIAEAQNIKVPAEVNRALQDVFYSDSGVLLNNVVGRFMLDNLSALTGLSKISKTLFNPASYAPNLIGNFASVFASGINPFKDMKRGFGLAFSEFGGIRKALYSKGQARKDFVKEKNRFEELGLGSGNVLTNELRRAGKGGPLGNVVQSIAAPFSKVYNVGDVTMRYVAWKGTQKQLMNAVPELARPANKDRLERAAARMVNDTFQNYDKVPEILKKLSQMGIANPFLNFTAELMRNMYNQGRFAIKMIKDQDGFMREIGLSGVKLDDKAKNNLLKLGFKRVAYLATVVGGAGAMLDSATSNASVFGNYRDLNESEKRAFNETIAKSWHRGKRMVVLMNKDGKSGKYFDSEYLVPQTLLYSALRAGLSEERFDVLPKLFADNFLGEGGFLLQAAPALLSGKDQNGREISVEPGLLNRFLDNAIAFTKTAFEPGVVRELDRWNDTIRGQENALTMLSLTSRLFGFRHEEFDLKADAARRMAPQTTALNNAKKILGSSRKYDIKEQYDRKYVELNEGRAGILKQITKHYNNLKTLGLDDDQVLDVLDETALSTNDKFEAISGRYSPMPYDQPVTKTEMYESLGSTPEERLKAIQNMRKEGVNPVEIRNLLSMHKRMVRKASGPQANLPPQLKLLSKMSKEDRLRRLTDPNGAYRLTKSNIPLIRELTRMGILSRDMIPYLPPGP